MSAAQEVTAYEDSYADYGVDILGENKAGEDAEEDNDPWENWGKKKRSKKDAPKLSVSFDFRRGKDQWPEGAELVDDEMAEDLLRKAEEEANKANEMLKEKGNMDDIGYEGTMTGGYGAGALTGFGNSAYGPLPSSAWKRNKNEDSDDEDGFIPLPPALSPAPEGAKFETLADRSTALYIQNGQRLKLDMRSLTSTGLDLVNREKKKKEKERRKQAKADLIAKGELGNSTGQEDGGLAPQASMKVGVDDMNKAKGGRKGGMDSGYDDVYGMGAGDDDFGGLYGGMFKEMVNEYTITMDIRLKNDIPREGMALYQTALIHMEENARTGKKKLKQSTGECLINSEGGVGILGKYGETLESRVEKNQWHRVVVAVKCGKENNKGQVCTWIDAHECAKITSTEITKDGRFAIDPDSLFLFSSSKGGMMPGGVLLRYIKVESGFSDNNAVANARAEDKFISMFMEDREKETDELRRGLSLAKLFPKPRPIWTAPALTGTVGDAYIEGTNLENNSLIGWSYTVLSHTIRLAVKDQAKFMGTFSREARSTVSDVCYIVSRSSTIMKQMLRLLRFRTKAQLISYLKKLRKELEALGVGDSILLPAMIENTEMVIIVIRTNDQRYRFVIVQTDPQLGLRHHPVSPVEGPPKLKYRTCMVLSNVPKKNALDNVFWLAVYNLSISKTEGDMNKFYDILLPFLTGKPLESSLVEAELAASKDDDIGAVGGWRSPQRSETGHVKCLLEAVNYLLRSRGLTSLEAKQVTLALRAEFVAMIINDMEYITPNENGQRVCRLACSQLGYAAVKLVNKKAKGLRANAGGEKTKESKQTEDRTRMGEEEKVVDGAHAALAVAAPESKEGLHAEKNVPQSFTTYVNEMLALTKEMVDKVHKKLEACKNDVVELPSPLDLKGARPIPVQERESLATTKEETKGDESATKKQEAEAAVVAEDDDAEEVNLIKIKVKHTLPRGDKRPMEFKVNANGTVGDLVSKIQKLTGVPPELQRLVFMGKLLNAEKKFSAYKITRSNLVVHLATKNIPDDKIQAAMSSREGKKKGGDASGAGKVLENSDDVLPNGLDAALTQFQDALAWDLEYNEPDPGQVVSLNSYVPVDFLQIPSHVTTRHEAILAVRQCDRLCTLLDNQRHCVKNEKMLIFALVQYVFTEVLPVPKPRRSVLSEEEEYKAARRDRRHARKYGKWKELKKNEHVKRNKTPPYMKVGKIVEAQYEGENLWYKAEVIAVDLDAELASIVFEDGEEMENVPFINIRGLQGANKRSKMSTTRNQEGEGEADGNEDEELFDAIDALGEEQGLDMRDQEQFENDDASDSKDASSGTKSGPDFSTGESKLKALLEEECIWDSPIAYEQQLDTMLTLQRIVEQFIAATSSIQQNPAVDGVAIVVVGAITAISDSIMRRRAVDVPSHACTHLMGITREGRRLGVFGYGIGVSWFSKQTETIQIRCPEVSLTRTAVLDYFQSPEQQKLHKIFTWEASYPVKLNKHTIEYLRNIYRDIASSDVMTTSLVDTFPESSKMFKNYPELRSYRDIIFWWKYLLNPDVTEFPNYVNPKKDSFHVSTFERMQAQLSWRWDPEDYSYVVTALSKELHCRPNPEKDGTGQPWKADRQPSQYRYPSTAKPSFYVPKPEIRTEDDVIYRPNLPGFEYSDPKKPDSKIHVLGQHDSELLISYLTVPYLRLPLVLTFFASDDRLHKLQSPKLRGILDSVLFEPGKYLRMDREGVMPVTVPATHQDLLASSHGMLLNELQHSPDVVLKGMLSLLRGALALDTGSVCDGKDTDFNSGVEIILYITRLACRVTNYLSFLIQVETGTHESVRRKLRGVNLTNDCLEKLRKGLADIEELLHQEFEALLEHYLRRLDDETKKNLEKEEIIGRNSRLSCDLHAHKLLMYRNLTRDQFTTEKVRILLSSFVYLTTRHSWNRYGRLQGRLSIAETELYELLQHRKRSLVEWCRELNQGDLDKVMQSALQISTSATGSVGGATAEIVDASNRWSRIKGTRSVGRYAVSSTRTKKLADKTGPTSQKAKEKTGETQPDERGAKPILVRQNSEKSPVDEVVDDGRLGVEMDLQIGQMTLRSRHLSALDDEIANDEDVRMLFGSTDIQASLLDKADNRVRYRLVGLQHDLAYWEVDHRECPPISDEWERDYDPSEMFDSEQWILPIFEPIRRAFFNGPMPKPMQFLLPALALPEDAEVAVIMGLSQVKGGPYKLIYVFRRLKCVHVYQCVTYGRQWYWTLHMVSDTRYSLRELEPYSFDRQLPFPAWLRHGSGEPYPPTNDVPDKLYSNIDRDASHSRSVVIEREMAHPNNLSGGVETFLPIRFLYGLIPHCLLEEYHFWQDETWSSKPKSRFGRQTHPVQTIRGYPRQDDNEHMLIIEFQRTGSWLDVQRRRPGAKNGFNDNGVEILGGLPGRTVRVRRTQLTKVKEDFHRKSMVALALETSQLLRDKEEEEEAKKEKEKALVEQSSSEVAAEVAMAERIARKSNKKYGSIKYVDHMQFVAVGQTVRYQIKKQLPVLAVVIAKHDDDTYDIKLNSGASKGVILRDVGATDLQPKVKVSSNNETPVKWQGMDDSEDAIWDSSSEEELSGEEGKKMSRRRDGDSDDDDSSRSRRRKLNFVQFRHLGALLAAADDDVSRCTDILYHLAAIPGNRYTEMSKLIKAVTQYHQKLPPTVQQDPTDVVEEKAADTAHQDDLILLNLLYAPRRSRLHSLMKTLARIENMSNVCAWARAPKVEEMIRQQSEANPSLLPDGQRILRGCPEIDLVELPRLKLSFTTRPDHEGNLRLYSMDHADLFVSNERNPLAAQMLRGIPHSLLMSNSEGETQILVPVVPPRRPKIHSEPFTTQLVLIREDDSGIGEKWFKHVTQRYFLYPVHVSMSFLLTRGVESALYLMLLRFLQRNYAEVFRLADSIATDTRYSETGEAIFREFTRANNDAHPDAHACRLKMSLVTIDSDMEPPWDLTHECASYVVKLPHVSAACRMSKEEELQLLETEDAVVLDDRSPLYDKHIHNPFICAIVQNRLFALRATSGACGRVPLVRDASAQSSALVATGGRREVEAADGSLVEVPCVAPARNPSSGWPYYTDNTVFGEKYAGVVPVDSVEDFERQLRCRGLEDEGERCKPARGWLAVACFHTLWSEESVRVLSTLQELAPAFPACVFLSVRADAIGMSALAHKHDLYTFPSFLMFRDAQLLEDETITGKSRATELLVRFLQQQLDDDDAAAYQRLLEAQREGEPAQEEEALDPNEEIQWTWDVEQCGLNVRVGGLGMAAVLAADDEDGPQGVWEFSTHGRWGGDPTPPKDSWEPFPAETNRELEKQYLKGMLFDDCLDVSAGRPVMVWEGRVRITSDMVTGMHGEFQSPPWEDIQVRRRGMRVVVPGEPDVDPEQKLLDQQVARMREILNDRKQQTKLARKGKDCEAVRGTVGFVPNSGTHKWTVRWDHEPSRSGRCDAVGFVSESGEAYGPAAPPLLGGADESSSVALYANGELFYGNEKIAEAQHRTRKTVEQRAKEAREREEHFKKEMKKRKDALQEAIKAKQNRHKSSKQSKKSEESKGAEEEDSKEKSDEVKTEKNKEKSDEVKTEENKEKSDELKSATESEKNQETGKDGDDQASKKETSASEKEDSSEPKEENSSDDNKDDTDKPEEEDEDAKKRKEFLDFIIEHCPDAPLGSLAKIEKREQHNLWGQANEITVILNSDVEDGLVTFQVDGEDIPELRISGLFTMLGGGAVYPSVCMAPFENVPAEEEAKRKFEEQNKKLRAGALATVASKSRKLRGKEMRESKMADPIDKVEDKTDAKEEEEAKKKREEEEKKKKEEQDALAEAVEKAYKASFGIDRDILRNWEPEKLNAFTTLLEELVVGQPSNPTVYVLGQDNDELAISMMEELQNDAKEKAAETGEEVEENDEDDSDSDSDQDEADKDKEDDDEDAIALEKCMWMYETEKGWEPYSSENCKQLEMARRSGAKECELYVENNHALVSFGKDAKADSEQISSTGESSRVRRHVASDGLMGQVELLSMQFAPPSHLLGSTCVKTLQNVWQKGEDMLGRSCGYGFLLLYQLLQGQMRCKVISSGWWDRYNVGFGAGASKSDSHRFGLLLSQLYTDRRKKSLPTSIINVLARNRQLCPRMRKFRDNRKNRRAKVFNGWVDEVEPQSPLATLLSGVVPAVQELRRRRGAMQFPPRPPHPELPAPPKHYLVESGENSSGTERNRMELKPELTDTSCAVRELEPVSAEDIANLAHLVGHSLGHEDRWYSEPPLLVDAVRSLKEVVTSCKHEIIVIKFFATWCRPCESLDPVYRVLANTTPIARFLKIDIDDCDDIAHILEIDSVPTVCMFRVPPLEHRQGKDGKQGTLSSTNFGLGEKLTTLRGAGSDGGLEFKEKFLEQIAQIATDEENAVAKKAGVFDIPTFRPSDDDRTRSRIDATSADDAIITAATNRSSNASALKNVDYGKQQTKSELATSAKQLYMDTSWGDVECLATMPLKEFTDHVSKREKSSLENEENSIIQQLPFNLHNHDSASNAVAKSMLNRMEDDMAAWAKSAQQQNVMEMKFLTRDLVVQFFSSTDQSISLSSARESLMGVLSQLRAARDRDSSMVQESIPLLTSVANFIALPSSRETRTDEEQQFARLQHLLRRDAGQEPVVWIEFLFGALLSSRSVSDIQRLNPFLDENVIHSMLKLINVVVLRANRVGHINRCVGAGLKLLRLLERTMKLETAAQRQENAETLIPNLCQASESMARSLVSKRHYVGSDDSKFVFDPRFMIFEFTWNIMLRKKQVEIVNMFMENYKLNNSKVKQMIMGAGKTTVVAPLLALMLADGDSLVLSVVPKALLEMSRKRMRETFATIMQKRVYTLKFDRGTEVNASLARGLENAARNRGIVVATPTALKSIMLAYVEGLSNLQTVRAGIALDTHSEEEADAARTKVEELGRVLKLFKSGSMLLDEVDLILHPLKSELNFPVGEKFDLDVSEHGERWGLPVHLLDAVFFAQTGKVCTFEQRGSALDILKRLAAKVDEGYKARALQKLPHITLLNTTFYHKELKPVLAEWAYLWLQNQHLHGIDHHEAIQYVLQGAASRSETTTKAVNLEKEIAKVKAKDTQALLRQSEQLVDPLDVPQDALEARLVEALESSKEHSQLTHEVYALQSDYESFLEASGTRLGELQAKIADTTAKLEEAQYPRDDSLDNATIVWLASKIESSVSLDSTGQGENKAGNPASTVLAQCGRLEDMGYTVKLCDDKDEALKRARELYSKGQLRCLVIGGGEQIERGCGKDCQQAHDGLDCLRCEEEWDDHDGHMCDNGNSGVRGSFPVTGKSDDDVDIVSVTWSATNKGNMQIPENRIFVFCGHCVLETWARMDLWRQQISTAERPDDLFQLVEMVEEYPEDEGGAENQDVSSESECEDDVDDGEESKKNKGTAGEELARVPRGRPKLVRQASVGTVRLERLKVKLEKLERKKARFTEMEEKERKQRRVLVTRAYEELQRSIDSRISLLRAVCKKQSAISNGEIQLGSGCGLPIAYGHEAALALSWLDRFGNMDEKSAREDSEQKAKAQQMVATLENECKYLNHIALAAKVMANVSLFHKKLLNLAFDWLKTFMPHCLAKVNRVSFGLLNEDDCAEALQLDPHMPRSRLKLAVPFVGKDVPSASSEFAHPDVIIGLTILAYRYSGMRKTDFDDIVDRLTMDFSHEIGPASERQSTMRHELWVRESGGHIRGITTPGMNKKAKTEDDALVEGKDSGGEDDDDEREVVQLKYLQKSNYEQTTKLFKLWKKQPHVIHHYLNHFIFPAHMRSQKVKISSSGQAVGGDMLFGHRIGFSGTPSDLLPKELGKCDYETGDDGKMLSTVLDPNITGFEHMENDWTVEDLLQRIATASPRYNSLIDTGALITGYSNQEVAEKLLELGLAWCEGVVFLDSQDKQQVLVRATNRVVNADQCGIPLEKRFAFYDQIHTTGMDIQHVVNARAVVTLGKDMVFRDYVQGVYRMRGVGQGQQVTVFIIPEVSTLMAREMAKGVKIVKLESGQELPERSRVLVNIVAWLIINSMRSEQVQWSMLCQQSVANVYRMNAFQRLMLESNTRDSLAKEDASTDGQNEGSALAVENPASKYLSPEEVEQLMTLSSEECARVFDEAVDFSLEATVPDPTPFAEKLRNMLESHSHLLLKDAQRQVGDSIIAEVEYYSELDGEDMSQRLESEQEREQEQEQEKEVKAKRDQQIEVEKFIDREYSRANENPVAWAFSTLARPPSHDKGNFDHPFHRLSTLTLRHQDPLKFPSYLYFSRNYFNPEWNSLRRVKNVVMVLEWAPSSSQLRVVSPEDCRAGRTLSETAQVALEKAYRLLAARTGELTPSDVYNTVRAAADVRISEAQLGDIMATFGNERDAMDQQGLRELLTSGILRQEEKGRYFVAVSLAEAETIKRILHVTRTRMAESGTRSLIPGADTEVALRYTPLASFGTSNSFLEEGVVFESSLGWTEEGTVEANTMVPKYQSSVAHSCMRFLDCNMHYNEPALNVLIRALQDNATHERERFFHSTIGFRRRLERKWQETPLAKVFTVDDEWVALKQRAQAVFMREAIEAKRLTLWEAFTAFDADDNGVLSPAEFYGAVRWLGMKDLSPEDVVDMIEAADRNRDGLIDYKEYLEMLRDPDAQPGDEGDVREEDEEATGKRAKPLVEPFGAETLREVMVERKREELRRQREDRLKRQAYQKTVDIKVFEEELEANKSRARGANPRIARRSTAFPPLARLAGDSDSEFSESESEAGSDAQLCEYLFTGFDKPLRMVKHGQVQFGPTFGRAQVLTHGAIRSQSGLKCDRGHVLERYNSYWDSCSVCGQRRTEWECYKCYITYYLCRKCHKRLEDLSRTNAEKVSQSDTFLDCSMGGFITVQIPAALSDEGLGDLSEEEGKDPLPLDVSCKRFTVSLEVLVHKLPSRGQLAALLRFSPAQMGRSRRRNQASVYIDEHGLLTDGSTVDREEILKAQLAAKTEEEKDLKSANALQGTQIVESDKDNVAGKVGEQTNDSAVIDEKEKNENVAEGEKEKKGNVPKEAKGKDSKTQLPVHISSGSWHYVSVVVDAILGTMSFYVDGKFCNAFKNLREEDITLQHQLIVFGGAKQGHLRGGGIRRVRIDNCLLHPGSIKEDVKFTQEQRGLNVVWCSLNENVDHEAVIKNLSKKNINVEVCSTLEGCVEAMENKFQKRVHCVVTTLTDIPVEDEEGNILPSPLKNLYIKELRGSNVQDSKESDKESDTNSTTSDVPQEELEDEIQHADGLQDLQVGLLFAKCLRKRYPLPVPVIIDTTKPKQRVPTFILGEQVKAKYQGKKYFPGVITKANREKGIYDVEYDDGDVETDVKAELIKPLNNSKNQRTRYAIEYWVNDEAIEICNQMHFNIAGSMDHIEELIGKQVSKRPIVSEKELQVNEVSA